MGLQGVSTGTEFVAILTIETAAVDVLGECFI